MGVSALGVAGAGGNAPSTVSLRLAVELPETVRILFWAAAAAAAADNGFSDPETFLDLAVGAGRFGRNLAFRRMVHT